MNEFAERIERDFPVRRKEKEKVDFRTWLVYTLKELGYSPKLESGTSALSAGGNVTNVVVGDIEKAKIVLAAHYDTGVREVLPPLICPTRPATYMLYEALMPLLALAVSFLISFGVTFALNMPNMTLPLFLLLSLGIGVAVIAWSITVREDLGSPSPRQHTRYLEPLLIPLLAVTLDTLDEKLTKTRRRSLAALTIAWGVLFVAVCRAIGAGAGDNTLLQWFDFVADRTDRLPVLGQGAWLAVWRAVIAVGVAALGVLLVRRRGRRVLAGAALVLCVLCYAGEWRINRWTYEVPAGTAQQASALNDALAELDGRVLFIPYGVRQRDSQLIETYVARDVYIVEYETLLQSGALADGVLDLTAEAVGPEYPGRAYTDLDAADWVLAADGVPVDTTTLEKADAACPAGYVLYRNLDAQRVRFAVS